MECVPPFVQQTCIEGNRGKACCLQAEVLWQETGNKYEKEVKYVGCEMARIRIKVKTLEVCFLPTNVCLVKVLVFPVVTYGCESWTIKKAEPGRIYAFDCGVGEDS